MELTKEERLVFYKKMLKDYKKSFMSRKRYPSTSRGLCNYIVHGADRHAIDVNMQIEYPELFKQKPKKTYKNEDIFWYKPGRLLPRIICIYKAIKLCENEIRTDSH